MLLHYIHFEHMNYILKFIYVINGVKVIVTTVQIFDMVYRVYKQLHTL